MNIQRISGHCSQLKFGENGAGNAEGSEKVRIFDDLETKGTIPVNPRFMAKLSAYCCKARLSQPNLYY